VTASAPSAEAIYQPRLIPPRSLTLRQAHVFILLFGAGTCALSVPFYILGAWPVVGFMGLDVLALYVALRVSFRSARAFESISLTPFELVIVKKSAYGLRRERRFDTYWLRLETEEDEEFGMQRVLLVSRGERVEIGDVADAPVRIALAQRRIEHGVADGGVLAVALERAVEHQQSVRRQHLPRAREQSLRHRPRRDMDDVGAEHRGQLRRAAGGAECADPAGIGQIDALRVADVGQPRVPAPRRDAREMIVVQVARPPCQVRPL
jgi:uncharacterized membrane protein